MPIMPEKTNSEAPFPQQSRGFHGGKDVDIEGVTGSIPVTPTIRTPANQGLGQPGAKCPTGSPEPRSRNWLRRLTLCKLQMCPAFPSSNDTHCWGQCLKCDRRFGVTSRAAIRRYIEAEEAARSLAVSERAAR